jgi:hypothetical protein
MLRKMIMLGFSYGFMGIGSLAMVLAWLTGEFPVVITGAAFTLLGMFLWWRAGD